MKYLWAAIVAAARAANTHRICLLGVGFAFLSLGAIGAHQAWDQSWATTHFGPFAGIVRAFVDGAATVGLVIVWPAIIAAALGRPPTIPGGPPKP